MDFYYGQRYAKIRTTQNMLHAKPTLFRKYIVYSRNSNVLGLGKIRGTSLSEYVSTIFRCHFLLWVIIGVGVLCEKNRDLITSQSDCLAWLHRIARPVHDTFRKVLRRTLRQELSTESFCCRQMLADHDPIISFTLTTKLVPRWQSLNKIFDKTIYEDLW
jgi:hypothetical protein